MEKLQRTEATSVRGWAVFQKLMVRYLGFVELPQFLLVFAVVCILALVAAEELLDLLPVLSLELLQSRFLLLLKLSLGLAERPQLLLKGPSHLLHLPRHGHHALRVLPKETPNERLSQRKGGLIYGFLGFKASQRVFKKVHARRWCAGLGDSDLTAKPFGSKWAQNNLNIKLLQLFNIHVTQMTKLTDLK